MSDPCLDLEKGLTGLKEGLKEKDKGIAGLKEEEKAVQQFKHLKVMCVKRVLDVFPVLFFVTAMFPALSFYRQTHIWLPPVVLLPLAICNFWYCRWMKHKYIQHIASTDGDLSTALLTSSKK